MYYNWFMLLVTVNQGKVLQLRMRKKWVSHLSLYFRKQCHLKLQ